LASLIDIFDRVLVALDKLVGLKDDKTRVTSLSSEKRVEIAEKAAKARRGKG